MPCRASCCEFLQISHSSFELARPVDQPFCCSLALFFRTPIELVKVKMQVTLLTREGLMTPSSSAVAVVKPNFANLPGPFAIIKQTLATHGVRGLWLGQSGTLLRETGGSSAWFTAFEVVSRAFMRLREKQQGLQVGEVGKADLKAWELCVAGAAAGMSYNSRFSQVPVSSEEDLPD